VNGQQKSSVCKLVRLKFLGKMSRGHGKLKGWILRIESSSGHSVYDEQSVLVFLMVHLRSAK
jgi:hypothetical protein